MLLLGVVMCCVIGGCFLLVLVLVLLLLVLFIGVVLCVAIGVV